MRIAGRIICVGILSLENTVDMRLGITKRLSFIFSYGGQREDLEALLDLMSRGIINPLVEPAHLEDFPTVLQDLCDGKVKARMALSAW